MAPLDVDLRMWKVLRRSSGLGGFTVDEGMFDSAQSKVKFGEFSEAQPGARVAQQWKIHAESPSYGSCRSRPALRSSKLSAHQMGPPADAEVTSHVVALTKSPLGSAVSFLTPSSSPALRNHGYAAMGARFVARSGTLSFLV